MKTESDLDRKYQQYLENKGNMVIHDDFQIEHKNGD